MYPMYRSKMPDNPELDKAHSQMVNIMRGMVAHHERQEIISNTNRSLSIERMSLINQGLNTLLEMHDPELFAEFGTIFNSLIEIEIQGIDVAIETQDSLLELIELAEQKSQEALNDRRERQK